MSLTIFVPLAVPFVRHNSWPWVSVIGREVDVAANPRQVLRSRVGGPRSNVLDHRRAERRPVAAPELKAVRSITGDEDGDAVEVRESGRKRGCSTRIDVLDSLGAEACAVALPQLATGEGRRQPQRNRVPPMLVRSVAFEGAFNGSVASAGRAGPSEASASAARAAEMTSHGRAVFLHGATPLWPDCTRASGTFHATFGRGRRQSLSRPRTAARSTAGRR
jgi:hypothetical protein